LSESGTGAAATAPAIERWTLPQMQGPVIGRAREDRRAGAEAALRAREEAESRGYEAGLARAQAQVQARIAELDERARQLESVLQLLAHPLQGLDSQVESELTQLALAVGKQLARRELRLDPAQVIAIVRECLARLPAAAREVRVHLHPEDAATLRGHLAEPAGGRAWTIVEDPALSRGGCIVRTETSQIDARLESRVHAVVLSTLGEERTAERRPEADGAAQP